MTHQNITVVEYHTLPHPDSSSARTLMLSGFLLINKKRNGNLQDYPSTNSFQELGDKL